jgi:anoctamin-10
MMKQQTDKWKLLTKKFASNEIDNDTKFQKSIERNYSGGGYLEKRDIPNTDDYDWICSNGNPNDFLTLIRFTVIAKLSRNANLHCR